MALVKLATAYPNYKQEIFGGDDIKGYDVYTENEEKVGSVYDALLDETGRFRYLVLDTGFWVFGKKVLVPVGRIQMDYDRHRVYVTGMTKEQAEALPEYNENMTVDYDYEERVRNVFRPSATGTAAATATQATHTRDTYNYDHEQPLYTPNEGNNQRIRLYEERVLTSKNRVKTGEVAIGKHVETETAQVSVPVDKERVIIERTTPSSTTEVTPGAATFQEGEVARMEVYEETANIQKQAFVREEVNIRKEVEHDTVEATETIRREELDVDVDGNPIINRDR
jgi:uncharacterized protein (TIGR02271 family)